MNTTRTSIGIIVMACLLAGLYCCELNFQLYQHKSPFYDSMAYQDRLFKVMTISREQGVGAALQYHSFSNTTVCLPFVVSALVAPVVSPNRFVGVWIQTSFLLLFLTSVFYYLTAVKSLKPYIALLGCLVFLTAACLHYEIGGLSDFRMDLALCLTFGITVCWYLSAMARPAWWRFSMLGLTAGLCCLSRGTAPVYLVFTFAPLVAWDLLNIRLGRKAAPDVTVTNTDLPASMGIVATGLALSVFIVILVAGWFYVGNFDYLYHYYVVWNTDANAKLPWRDALQHFDFMLTSIGMPFAAVWAAWSIGASTIAIRASGLKAHTALVIRNRDFDYRILWIGLAPAILIVARRSGLNPFVCMPSVIGLILFLTIPILKQLNRKEHRGLIRYCWIALMIGFALVGYRGWRRHQPRTGYNTMQAQTQVLDQLIADCQRRSQTQVNFCTIQLTDLNSSSLYAILQTDRDNVQRHLSWVEIEGIRFHRKVTFAKPAAADWAAIDGETDQAKIDTLIDRANRELDYIIVPDEATCKHLKIIFGHNYINRYLAELRTKVIAGPWEKVSDAIQVQNQEFVEIYRRIDER